MTEVANSICGGSFSKLAKSEGDAYVGHTHSSSPSVCLAELWDADKRSHSEPPACRSLAASEEWMAERWKNVCKKIFGEDLSEQIFYVDTNDNTWAIDRNGTITLYEKADETGKKQKETYTIREMIMEDGTVLPHHYSLIFTNPEDTKHLYFADTSSAEEVFFYVHTLETDIYDEHYEKVICRVQKN